MSSKSKESSKDFVTIVSIAPYKVFGVEREEGSYHLEGRGDGERFKSKKIFDGTATLDFGEGQKHKQTTPARELAEDLIRTSADHGVFIIDGDTPSEDELRAAEDALRERYAVWISEADQVWERTHDSRQITYHARVAAKTLGAQRAWSTSVADLVKCKACQELVQPNIPKCPKCQAVLNWEMAQNFGMLTPEQEKFATARGFISDGSREEVAAGGRKGK